MYLRGTNICLIYCVLNLADFSICMALSLTLLISKDLDNLLSEIVKGYYLYSHIVYTILLNILGLCLTGEFNNLVLERSFDKKSYYTKLKIMAFLLLFNLIFGGVLLYFFIKHYMKTPDISVIHASYGLATISAFDILLCLCVNLLHPDMWHFNRNREIRELMQQQV